LIPATPAAPAALQASCLCGQVAYQVTAAPGQPPYTQAVFCHCSQCRKASGSAFAVNAVVERGRLTWLRGHDRVREYESSPGKLRAFCSNCGSPLYSRRAAAPELLRIRLGTLDTAFELGPRAHIFVADKAAWDQVPDDGLPRFAQRP
jgi:hypothetical protein